MTSAQHINLHLTTAADAAMTDPELDALCAALVARMAERMKAGLYEELAAAKREIVEREEYQSLSDYQRGAYDYLGQRGGTHAECMAAANSI